MKVRQLHRKLLLRLLVGWVLLSAIFGAVVFFVKLEEIDDIVQDIAIAESKLILKDKRFFAQDLSERDRTDITDSLNSHIENGNFIALEIYTNEVKKLFEVFSKDTAAVGAHDIVIEPKEIIGKKNSTMFVDKITYEKFFIRSRIYLQFVVPLFDENNKKYGYFEGIYRADDHVMKDIGKFIIGSMLLVIVSVFVTAVIFYPLVTSMNRDLISLTRDLSDANIGILEALGSAIAKRDSDTNSHNYRVTIYAVSLGEALGLKEEEMTSLIKGSFLHDIGKIAVSDNILLKPGKLTEEEFLHMQAHVLHGLDIVGRYPWLSDAIDVIVYHHEKYDGTGYSGRLVGEDIPVNARIFAIADVFDALTSKRPYKEPLSYDQAIRILTESADKHFDPKLLQTFIRISVELYDTICCSQDEALEEILHGMVQKYFHGGSRTKTKDSEAAPVKG